jgi:hypothetical protein
MPAPAHLRTCECKRECKSRSGLATHRRSCRPAQAASAAFVRAIEGGQQGDRVMLARAHAIALAAEQPTASLEEIAEQAARHSAISATRPRCWCGAKASNSSPFCAEHD